MHSDENAYVFFVKKVTLAFVIDLQKWEALYPYIYIYFSVKFTFLFITGFPQSYSRARKLLYKLQTFCVVIWIKEKKHKFLKIYCNLSLICLYIIFL